MAKSRRGGYRQPKNPAPVATQDRNRTDGGPGNQKQPLRRIPGLPYGEQKDLTLQQQAAPLAGGGQATPMPQQQAQPARPDVFAPTERPMEPTTQGAAFGPGSGPADQLEDETDIILAALYSVNPHPVIAELINTRSV